MKRVAVENLNAIVWLYRGKPEWYDILLDHYEHLLNMYSLEFRDAGLLDTVVSSTV